MSVPVLLRIDVRLGIPDDVAAAVSVYKRSNLARRHGDWPSRSARGAGKDQSPRRHLVVSHRTQRRGSRCH
jgi:hypothetical protein